FDHRPLHGKRPRIEPSANEQLAIHPKLRLNAPALVRPELAPEIRIIRLAHELAESLARLRFTRLSRLVERCIERVISHSLFLCLSDEYATQSLNPRARDCAPVSRFTG